MVIGKDNDPFSTNLKIFDDKIITSIDLNFIFAAVERVLSGTRATGRLHLGNYFGAVRNYVRMQEEYDCFFMIADYHSLTTHTKPDDLKRNVKDVLVHYLGAGLDPEKAPIYIQSDVPEVTELYLLLNMFAYKGELEKTTTFKEKARVKGQTLNAGLMTYPVLMAADILLHRATKVPVGEDQLQHIEMTRKFAKRFNHYYQTDFLPEPIGFNFGSELIRVPSLNGEGKMSKSDSENNAIFIDDEPEVIIKKMKKAKTDSGPTEKNQAVSSELNNLFALMELVSKPEVIAQFKSAYADCSIRYGDLKMKIAEDMIAFTEPMREKIKALYNDADYLKKVTSDGAELARTSARQTLNGVREIMGLSY